MFNSPGSSPLRVDSNHVASQVGATSLLKDDVYDVAGKRMGEIDEMILDARTGCIRYVVVAHGGFLGIGRKHLAIPWNALTFDLNYQRCVVDEVKMKLMAVQVFDDDPWLQRIVPSPRSGAP